MIRCKGAESGGRSHQRAVHGPIRNAPRSHLAAAPRLLGNPFNRTIEILRLLQAELLKHPRSITNTSCINPDDNVSIGNSIHCVCGFVVLPLASKFAKAFPPELRNSSATF